jgi:hypothetical protein
LFSLEAAAAAKNEVQKMLYTTSSSVQQRSIQLGIFRPNNQSGRESLSWHVFCPRIIQEELLCHVMNVGFKRITKMATPLSVRNILKGPFLT